MGETVLVISDTQAPFQHRDTLAFLKHLKDTYKPTKVVHIGDVMDLHCLSEYVKNPDGLSAGHELKEAVKFLKDLYKMFPEVTVLTSNHDVRAYKKAASVGIPRAFLRDYNEWFESPPGWRWVDDIKIDDVLYIHGHQIPSGGGNIMYNAIKKYIKSVVFGHFHTRLGVDYYATEDFMLFGLCVGSLIDHKAYAFEYQRMEARKPLIGTAVIVDGHPYVEPMLLNKKGRWKGARS